MNTSNVKEEAHRLVDRLSADATWDDLMYEIYVRKAIERGLEDSESKNVQDVSVVRQNSG